MVLVGGKVTLPDSDYVTVNASGGHTETVKVRLTDSYTPSPLSTVGVGLAFTAAFVCPPAGSSSPSTSISTSFV